MVRPAISRFLLTDGRVSVTATLGRPSLDRHQVERYEDGEGNPHGNKEGSP